MIFLLRENSHSNEVSVFYDSIKKKFYKTSLGRHGSYLLNNEVNGIKFFNSFKSNNKIKFNYTKKIHYTRLEIEKIKGFQANYRNSFYKNFSYFEKVTKFYLDNWPKNKNQYSHGDLTLDNVFFYKNKIIIFDWEHFKISKKLFFGYDLIYLLLSGLILPGENKFDYKSREKFKEIYKKLYRHKINKNFLNYPFDSIDKTLSNVFTNILIKSPKKFITMSIKSNFKDEILNFINKEIVK